MLKTGILGIKIHAISKFSGAAPSPLGGLTAPPKSPKSPPNPATLVLLYHLRFAYIDPGQEGDSLCHQKLLTMFFKLNSDLMVERFVTRLCQ